MSEALKKELIEECKRLVASYNPPLNHSIDEIRSDFKLIKSVHEKKRKREVLIEECKRLDASYNPPLNHSIDEVRSDFKLIKSVHEKKRKRDVLCSSRGRRNFQVDTWTSKTVHLLTLTALYHLTIAFNAALDWSILRCMILRIIHLMMPPFMLFVLQS